MDSKYRPILFFDASPEGKEAYLEIKKSSMLCEFRAPCLDYFSPLLLSGYSRYIGIHEIKRFLASKEDW